MEYRIKPNKGFLPPIDYWIFEDLKISTIEAAMIYKIILVNNALTWNSGYIARVLHISKSTVLRIIDNLCQKDVIKKETRYFGSRLRWVLIAKYNEYGKLSEDEINRLVNNGFEKLSINLKKRYYKHKKK